MPIGTKDPLTILTANCGMAGGTDGTSGLEFEFDERKRQRILAERDLDICHAALIFAGHVLTCPDRRQDYGEQRFISVGMVGGDCFVVVHTARSGRLRVITAWEGGRHERQRHQDDLARRTASDEGAG